MGTVGWGMWFAGVVCMTSFLNVTLCSVTAPWFPTSLPALGQGQSYLSKLTGISLITLPLESFPNQQFLLGILSPFPCH